ncbi:glucurono-1,5-lactonase [Pseudomonas capsici]|uniref:SMP-30/gluconolactonase/LRE family protein n=1 Tax=Pseudomonas capsici TaxID=2810614 RepID=A0ABT3BWU4_9PSED|nr:SMP-30/gluconolactonase/LRE family protein [Pseudomonas capsici]MBN6714726.1 SMP-30/gluconolactonase/LRE family protein [Pseudomonas capsici]MBN6719797.1 SMP-30/gluconolactonase/LRE family protein [Pseudomonas capsici]MBN6724247.1 SMP-30/gluconolactonase/LRE family protein [Pseudomonas capsici]MCV4268452.1 SMP-30/gluconolactonase/LRE family protein [Pseudomonas capsici]MCV4277923.1 SMP-30/gluconolactonase/LRE family protein [Pseudomonas capsici]
MDAELIFDARNATGESPVWSVREQALYWVDIPAGRLYRWNAADNRTQSWKAPQMLACIAAHSSGGWIAGMESGLFHLQPGEGESLTSTLLASVEHEQPGMRFNDGRCDRQGRFWAGTMLLDMAAGVSAGALYRYSAGQQQLNAQLHGYIVPNGLGFSPDGKTMYLSDSHPNVQKIWTFDYDTDSGTPHDRRLFVDMNDYPGRPDGAAVDSDGCYWICANDAGLIHRFTPQGRLDRSVTVPVKKPTMCAFGGSGLDTLYITSIRPGGDIGDQPLAGGVFAFRPGVTGLEEPIFQS